MFHILRMERRRDGKLEAWTEMGLTFSTAVSSKLAAVNDLAGCIKDTNKSKSGNLSIVLLVNGNEIARADNLGDSEYRNNRRRVTKMVEGWEK